MPVKRPRPKRIHGERAPLRGLEAEYDTAEAAAELESQMMASATAAATAAEWLASAPGAHRGVVDSGLAAHLAAVGAQRGDLSTAAAAATVGAVSGGPRVEEAAAAARASVEAQLLTARSFTPTAAPLAPPPPREPATPVESDSVVGA
eukprot:2790148-Prymnesium_polylepis.1